MLWSADEVGFKKNPHKKKKTHKAHINDEISDKTLEEDITKIDSLKEKIHKSKKSISELNNTELDKKKLKKAKKNAQSTLEESSHTISEIKRKKRKNNEEESAPLDDQTEENLPIKKSKKNKIDEVLRSPTKRELDESLKIKQDRKDKTPSKRKEKRDKHIVRLNELKEQATSNFEQKALNYLSMWKHEREKWKFNKKQSTWILNNIFNQNKIPDKIWELVLEYFQGSLGNTRKVLLEKTKKIIDSCEAEDSMEDNNEYERARQLIQYISE